MSKPCCSPAVGWPGRACNNGAGQRVPLAAAVVKMDIETWESIDLSGIVVHAPVSIRCAMRKLAIVLSISRFKKGSVDSSPS